VIDVQVARSSEQREMECSNGHSIVVMEGLFQPVHLLVVFAVVAFGGLLPVVAWWRILSRTGNPGQLGLLMLVPVLNVVLMFWFAFSDWPMERRLKPVSRSNFCPTCGTTFPQS
jgi:uncharacterized membrane protein YedE/YeeE